MLRELCRTAVSDDDFVGLRFIGGRPEVCFPRGYRPAESEKEARLDIIRLLSAIERFGDRREGDRDTLPEGETDLIFPLRSYRYLICDFLQNGYYTEREIRYIRSRRGKVSWKRTVPAVQPHLDGENVVYLDFVVKTDRNGSDNLLALIHEYCVYESFRTMGWLYFSGDALPQKPRLPLDKELFLSTLARESGKTFDDRKKRLFRSMINVINEAAKQTNNGFSAAFGVRRFEYIWEAMIDHVFGESDRERYYPKAHWHIVSRSGLRTESSELRPDTVMRSDGKIYILDAKYYKFGVTGLPAHLPKTDSIQKQITYGDYIAEKGFAGRNDIYNAFLMPYRAPEGEGPFAFAGVGIADWRVYGPKSENYNYVLGILVDTKYLIATYSRHNAEEIARLGKFIEEALFRYRADL